MATQATYQCGLREVEEWREQVEFIILRQLAEVHDGAMVVGCGGLCAV